MTHHEFLSQFIDLANQKHSSLRQERLRKLAVEAVNVSSEIVVLKSTISELTMKIEEHSNQADVLAGKLSKSETATDSFRKQVFRLYEMAEENRHSDMMSQCLLILEMLK